jgi:DNA-binding CsgD family transcriptional regulator
MDRLDRARLQEFPWSDLGDGGRCAPVQGAGAAAARVAERGRPVVAPPVSAGAPPVRWGGPAPAVRLTRREAEVLGLLARRWTDKEIAAALGISPRTAMGHVASILAKLGARNRREAAAVAPRLLA